MKSIRCVRCDRDVAMADDAIPELVFHHCPTRRRSRFSTYAGTGREEALHEERMRWARSQLGVGDLSDGGEK